MGRLTGGVTKMRKQERAYRKEVFAAGFFSKRNLQRVLVDFSELVPIDTKIL
jgi:hypothetical protein